MSRYSPDRKGDVGTLDPGDNRYKGMKGWQAQQSQGVVRNSVWQEFEAGRYVRQWGGD